MENESGNPGTDGVRIGAAACPACGGDLALVAEDLWAGAKSCPFCQTRTPLADLPGLGESQRELLAALQAGGQVADYDDYREDVPAEREGRVTVESLPGERFRAVVKRSGLHGGLWILLLVFAPLTVIAAWMIPACRTRDDDSALMALVFAGVSGAVCVAIAWFMLLVEEIRVDAAVLTRRWSFGPFVYSRVLFLNMIRDVLLRTMGKDTGKGKVDKALYVTSAEEKIRLGWAADTQDLRYLRAALLAFLRSVTERGFGREDLAARGVAGAGRIEIACPTCAFGFALAAEDFWRGFAHCPQCQAALRLGDRAAPAPAQKQALAEAEVFPVGSMLENYDDDALLPSESRIVVETGNSGRLRIVLPYSGGVRVRSFVLMAFGLVCIGICVALALRSVPLIGVLVFGFAGFTLIAANAQSIWHSLSREEVTLDREALVRFRGFGRFAEVGRYPLIDVRGFAVKDQQDSEGDLFKVLHLEIAGGPPVRIFAPTTADEVLYLRAVLARHLRSLRGAAR